MARSNAASVVSEASETGGWTYSHYSIRGLAKVPVRDSAPTTKLEPWRHLPMEAVVRDVRYDETFIILFGEEGAQPRAISFLNAIFHPDSEKDRIKEIRYLDGTLDSAIDRTLHFDVKIEGLCETYSGNKFIVQMQKSRIPARINSWVYYGARELAAMGERNYRKALDQDTDEARKRWNKVHYQRLYPVKVVTVLDFDLAANEVEPQNAKDVLVHWDICERESKRLASPLLSWTYVLLPRFSAALAPNGPLDFRGRPFDAWLYLMTRKDKERVVVTAEIVGDEEVLAQAYYRVSHLTEGEAEGLHGGQMAFISRISLQSEMFKQGEAKGFADGETKGFADGETKGFADGETKGFVKGKTKGVAEALKRLIEDGTTTLENISKSSLYTEEVKQKLNELLNHSVEDN